MICTSMQTRKYQDLLLHFFLDHLSVTRGGSTFRVRQLLRQRRGLVVVLLACTGFLDVPDRDLNYFQKNDKHGQHRGSESHLRVSSVPLFFVRPLLNTCISERKGSQMVSECFAKREDVGKSRELDYRTLNDGVDKAQAKCDPSDGTEHKAPLFIGHGRSDRWQRTDTENNVKTCAPNTTGE